VLQPSLQFLVAEVEQPEVPPGLVERNEGEEPGAERRQVEEVGQRLPQLLELGLDQRLRLISADRDRVVDQPQPAELVQPPQLRAGCQAPLIGEVGPSRHWDLR
jgi:hypothetical protein